MPARQASQANRGRYGEELVRAACDWYRRRGIAVITKVPTEWLPIRGDHGRIVSAKVERRAVVDFVGGWTGHGALAFDVKECSNDNWSMLHLEPHQYEFLADYARAGHVAFVLLVYHPDNSARVLPFATLARLQAERTTRRGLGTIKAHEILALPEATSREGCVCDFLAAWEHAMAKETVQ
jgi:recombination protein U